MSDNVKPEAGSTVQHITVNLRDSNNNSIEFKVRSSTKFARIAKAYAEKKGVQLADLRFTFDGNRIQQNSDQTMEQIGIEDGDTIDVDVHQVGGGLW